MDINNLWSEYDLKGKKQNTRCLAVNTILEGKYLVGPVLGQGGFGITYVGYDLNMETKIAIKEYFPVELVSRDTTTMHGDRVLSLSGEKSVTYQAGLRKYVEEAQNVSRFSEVPGIVSVKDFFYANETAYIVMEFIDGISLKDYLKEKGGKLSEEEALKIMKPILEALVQVHQSGMIHRDISPDNIMLTSSSVKLIDFGAARMTAKDDQKSLTIILKHGYAPEEQYRTHGEQGPWTDVYALCAVLYRMLTGETPVPAMDRMFQDELKAPGEWGISIRANTEAAILKGLAVKKEDRIQNVEELIGALYEDVKVRPTKGKGGTGKGSGRKSAPGKKLAFGAAAAVLAMALAVAAESSRNWRSADAKMDSSEFVYQENALFTDENGEESKSVNFENTDVNFEQTVWPSVDTMIAAGDHHVLSLREDGSVLAFGENYLGQCEVSDWENIAAVYANDNISAGLKKDGSVVITGNVLPEWVDSWSGITELAVGDCHIIGLREDGTVVSAGVDRDGSCATGDWSDVEHIFAGDYVSVGVMNDGTVKTAGIPEDQKAVREAISQWTNICRVEVQGEGENTIYYGIREDGDVVCAGLNMDEADQRILHSENIESLDSNLNWAAALKRDGTVVSEVQKTSRYQETENWTDICALAVTENLLIGLKRDGTLKVSGGSQIGNSTLDNILTRSDAVQAIMTDKGLCVLCADGTLQIVGFEGQSREDRLIEEELEWSDLVKIDTVKDHELVGLKKDGTLILCEYGSTSSDGTIEWEEVERRVEVTPKLAGGWKNIQDISSSSNHIAALSADGTVKAAGYPKNQYSIDYQTGLTKDGACEVSDWIGIRQVVSLNGITIGLTENGTLVFAGDYPEEWEEWTQYTNIASIWGEGTLAGNRFAAITEDGTVLPLYVKASVGQGNVGAWTDVTALSLSDSHIVGLRSDGTVYAAGSNFCGQCEVEDWTDVVSVAAGSTGSIGITSEGRILLAGQVAGDFSSIEDWDALPLESMLSVETIAEYSPQFAIAEGRHTLICKPDGTVTARGKNEYGQCEAEDWTDVVAVQVGSYHSLGLRSDGTVLAVGRSDYGACDVSLWSDVVQIYAEQGNSYGLKKDGTVLITGSSDEKEILQEISSWKDIKSISGYNGVIVGFRSDGTLLIAGSGREIQMKGWDQVETIVCCGQAVIGMEADGTIHAVDPYTEEEIEKFYIGSSTTAADFSNMGRMQQIAAPYAYGVTVDGHVVNGKEEQKEEWDSWRDMIAIEILGEDHAIGIQRDGTILETTTKTTFTQLDEFEDLEWAQFLSYGSSVGIIAQKKDGTGLYYGDYEDISEFVKGLSSDQRLVDAYQVSPEWILYLLSDGSVHFNVPYEYEPEYMDGLPRLGVVQIEDVYDDAFFYVMEDGTIKGTDPYDAIWYKEQIFQWEQIQKIAGVYNIYGLKTDGTVIYVDGRTEENRIERYVETITDICANKSVCLGVRKDGGVQVIEAWDDRNGCAQVTGWENITTLKMSESHTVGLRSDGTVTATGNNRYGQCDVEDWTDVVAIDVCEQCTLGITKDGALLIAGSLE